MGVYPIFLTNLDEQGAVVMGAGPSAGRKVEGLLEAGTRVTLIAPSLSASLKQWADVERVEWLERTYRDGDLEGVALAIVTDVAPETEARIWEEARRRNVLINTTGSEVRSTFSNGAALRRGPLVISISTSGAAPTLSVRLRQQLAGEFGPEYEELLDLMNALREPMQRHVTDFETRRNRWYELVDSEIIDLLASGRREEARTCVESIVGTDVMEEMEHCR